MIVTEILMRKCSLVIALIVSSAFVTFPKTAAATTSGRIDYRIQYIHRSELSQNFCLPSNRPGLRRHSFKVLKVRATAEGEGRNFRWGLWNTGKSSRIPSLQFLLSIFSRKGWRKSFPISSINWTLIFPIHCILDIDEFQARHSNLRRNGEYKYKSAS